MPKHVLQVGDDAVERLAHVGDPVQAVIELVWNAIDADAENVSVTIARGSTEKVESVVVTDDGHGINTDEVASAFGWVGRSWKKLATRTKGGKRTLHGKDGQGRLRVFALGSRVEWRSVAPDATGQLFATTITSDQSERNVFVSESQPARPDAVVGTTVICRNDAERNLNVLDAPQATRRLLAQFAPLLLTDEDLTISYDLSRLDPADHIAGDTTGEITFAGRKATVRVIEWREGKERRLYVGSDGTHFPYHENGTRVDGQFSFSAYVTWPGMTDDERAMLGLGESAGEPVGDMWKAATSWLRDHFNQRRRERRREQIREWKDEGAYPYKGEPASPEEEAERVVFDVITNTLVPHIAQRKDPARLTLALIKDALQNDPDRLAVILHEVVTLPESDRATLASLLTETTLSAIIRSANVISARRKFLASLDHIVFDPDDAKKVGERDHLHKILLRELWVFGEEYNLMNSERGLTQLARTHLQLEGLPTTDLTPITRADGSIARVDLHLAVADRQHGRTRYLVVELKAPRVSLGRSEITQVEEYANAVLDNPVFASGAAEWDFILVGADYDQYVARRFQGDPDLGLVFAPDPEPGKPRVRVFARKWRSAIDENLARLQFLSEALALDPSISDGMEHLRREHGDLLPAALSGDSLQPDPAA